MSMLSTVKRIGQTIPEPVGRVMAHVPFAWRLGRCYAQSKREIAQFKTWGSEARRAFIFERVKRIVHYAAGNNSFYRDFYAKHGFSVDKLRSFDDIQQIPIVTKADLQQYDLESRSNRQAGRLRVNTGGTSGEPLEFYLNRRAFAKEWAHMHRIWARLGYVQTDLKLTFRGKKLGPKVVKYNAVHNEFVVNAYADPAKISKAILDLVNKRHIKFIHGYPSTVYEFARYCDEHAPALSTALQSTLHGILLGSEFPAPVYRNLIESKFRAPTLSWYGHSEMAVLADEPEKHVYAPMQTYGYCEAVKDSNGEFRLVGTSYDNVASPFIRYDTGDHVLPESDNHPLERFRIASGRVGEYIVDAHGHRISLTALVFGRHHEVFRFARFVQVRQERPGEATILVTMPPGHGASEVDVSDGFDKNDVAIRFDFEVRNEPVRSSAGKVPLLVSAGHHHGEEEKQRRAAA